MRVLPILLGLLVPLETASGVTYKDTSVTRLYQFARRQGYRRSYKDIAQIYKVAEELGSTCQPKVFNQFDFLAVAFTESQFNTHAIGKYKERGVWQILKWKQHLKKIKATDAFDVTTNGRMACDVLKEKWRTHKNYKKAIQGFNGIRRGMKHYPYYNRVARNKKMLISAL